MDPGALLSAKHIPEALKCVGFNAGCHNNLGIKISVFSSWERKWGGKKILFLRGP